MNKILATGLIAAVAVTTAKAEVSACGDGGFYVGVNLGASFGKTKTNTDKHTYKDGDNYSKDGKIKVKDASGTTTTVTAEEANALSEDIASTHKVNKKKTNFLAELVLGYDFRINDVMIGVDLEFGSTFGKQGLKSKDSTTTNETITGDNPGREFGKLKHQWHVAFKPSVTYLFTPQFGGFITIGVKVNKMKYETYQHGDAGLNGKVLTEDTKPAKWSTFTNEDKNNEYDTKTSKKSTRVGAVFGFGVRYEIMPELFTKLEYNFEPKVKAKMPSDGIVEVTSVKRSAHIIKLGLGYRF